MTERRSHGSTTRNDLAIILTNAGMLMPVSDFMREVRDLAGFRVSPRQVAAAAEALDRNGQRVSAEAISNIVTAVTEGDKSQRQRRNSTLWLELGAVLETRDMDGSPEGQRRFVAGARRAAGRGVNDELILDVSLIIASTDRELSQNLIGRVARRAANQRHTVGEPEIRRMIESETRHSGK